MGLDQYAYIALKAGQDAEFWENAELNPESGLFENPTVNKPQEIAYWRKHPNLQGWMRNLWESKGNEGDFNGDELELTWDDVDRLEKDIKANKLATLNTTGFFFGNPSDYHYREQDLEFCLNAKTELFLGRKVFYNSSW